MFSTYHTEQVITSDGNIYFLQYATFTKKEVMEENIKKLDDYIINEDNGKYYVYIGASTILENANKLKKILEDNGIYSYIKNDYLSNSELINKINIIDKEIVKCEKNSEILEKNQEILKILKK